MIGNPFDLTVKGGSHNFLKRTKSVCQGEFQADSLRNHNESG